MSQPRLQEHRRALSFNGGQACDAITGMCACGAEHGLEEIILGKRKLTSQGSLELRERLQKVLGR